LRHRVDDSHPSVKTLSRYTRLVSHLLHLSDLTVTEILYGVVQPRYYRYCNDDNDSLALDRRRTISRNRRNKIHGKIIFEIGSSRLETSLLLRSIVRQSQSRLFIVDHQGAYCRNKADAIKVKWNASFADSLPGSREGTMLKMRREKKNIYINRETSRALRRGNANRRGYILANDPSRWSAIRGKREA